MLATQDRVLSQQNPWLNVYVVRLSEIDLFMMIETNLNEEAPCLGKLEAEFYVSQIGLIVWLNSLKIATVKPPAFTDVSP